MPRHTHPSIEPLEARIAPAAVVSFPDTDGDTVKVTTTKGSVVQLTAAIHHNVGGQLDLIDLSSSFFAGTGLTVTVTALGAHGDGVVDIGYINAGTNALGAVLVKGDLGKIVAGTSDTKPGVASLTVNSLGLLGTTTGAPDLASAITGNLGPLKILGDLDTASLAVSGKLASATIGGSLVGGTAAKSGSLSVAGAAGAVKIGGSLQGGMGDSSGSLLLSATATTGGAITVNGALAGGDGPTSGAITVNTAASIFVGGAVIGGSTLGGISSGSIAVTKVGALTVDGNLVGGPATRSGSVSVASSGGLVYIGGDLVGSQGILSGSFVTGGQATLTGVTIQGNLIGGVGAGDGSLVINAAGTVFICGSVYGGGINNGNDSNRGGIVGITGLTNAITIGGSLVGGVSENTGTLTFVFTKALKIGGSVSGNVALNTGSIFGSVVGTVDIGGNVTNVGIGFGSTDTPDTTIQVAKSVHVGGSVSGSYFEFGTKTRSDLSVGTFTVDGNWTASDLLVGAINLGTDDAVGGAGAAADNISFGDSHDTLAPHNSSLLPSITSIVIEGAIAGDATAVHYGFVASKIGSFRAGAVTVPLNTGASNDLRDIGGTNVSIHEIGGTTAKANPAPGAVPVHPATVVFTDVDGDTVKVTSSKGTTADLMTAVSLSNNQLKEIDLASFAAEFKGTNLSVTVTALGPHGNGTVNVGFIDADGLALGTVLVKGDLGKIVAGTADNKPAIGSLTVNSLGVLGTTTGASDLESQIIGNLGPLKVFGDVVQAHLAITGKLASATIGGSVVGVTAAESGSLTVAGATGAVKIGGNLAGGGGSGSGSLDFSTAPSVGAITIGGGLFGGSGGAFIDAKKAASISIGGDIVGGSTSRSGGFFVTQVGNITIGGGVFGGGASTTGAAIVDAKAGIVKIGGSVLNGTAMSSGYVSILGPSTSVYIGGSLVAGGKAFTGNVTLDVTGALTVRGSINGFTGLNNFQAGSLTANKVGAVTIDGSIFSDGSGNSGTLAVLSATSLKVLGTVDGANDPTFAVISATASLGTLDISGNVTGAGIFIGGMLSKAGSTVATTVHTGGSVNNSLFVFGSFERADVKVGTFTVDGGWTASSLLVGAVNLGADDTAGGAGANADNVNFGDSHDARAATSASPTAFSSIASIVVEGAITGTAGGSDHFGFVAGQISAFRAGAVKLALKPKNGNDSIDLGPTTDVTIRELV